MRENRKNSLYKHARYLALGMKDSKEWKTSKNCVATKEEVAVGTKEAEVYVKATQEALTAYAAPWMDKPYGALDKETEGLLVRGWAQGIVRSERNLREMAFRQQNMSERQWTARIAAEKKKLMDEWARQDQAYLEEQTQLRVAREATVSK